MRRERGGNELGEVEGTHSSLGKNPSTTIVHQAIEKFETTTRVTKTLTTKMEHHIEKNKKTILSLKYYCMSN